MPVAIAWGIGAVLVALAIRVLSSEEVKGKLDDDGFSFEVR